MNDQIPTIGEQLRQAREELGLTLSELSISTRIKERYLAAIEADRFQILPSPIQQKGFVRAYAQALGIDPDALIPQLPIVQDAQGDPEDLLTGSEQEESPAIETDLGMSTMGETIKRQRERMGYLLSDVEEQIYIPERYLDAIEGRELDLLPSTVQGRGMVKNYAEFLGLDPEPLLLQYAATLQARYRAENPQSPSSERIKLPVWLRRLISGPMIAGLIIVLVVTSAVIWSSIFVFGDQEAEFDPTETIPGVAEILIPTDTPLPTPSPSPEGSGEIVVEITRIPEGDQEGIEDVPATSTIIALTTKDVQIQLIILQRSWVRVVVDDNQIAFEGRLVPGSVETFDAENRIEILTGNAGGVEVIFNQQDLGVMGLYGEVVSRIYTEDGIATPTPTISLTPTITETTPPTSTPTPTAPIPE